MNERKIEVLFGVRFDLTVPEYVVAIPPTMAGEVAGVYMYRALRDSGFLGRISRVRVEFFPPSPEEMATIGELNDDRRLILADVPPHPEQGRDSELAFYADEWFRVNARYISFLSAVGGFAKSVVYRHMGNARTMVFDTGYTCWVAAETDAWLSMMGYTDPRLREQELTAALELLNAWKFNAQLDPDSPVAVLKRTWSATVEAPDRRTEVLDMFRDLLEGPNDWTANEAWPEVQALSDTMRPAEQASNAMLKARKKLGDPWLGGKQVAVWYMKAADGYDRTDLLRRCATEGMTAFVVEDGPMMIVCQQESLTLNGNMGNVVYNVQELSGGTAEQRLSQARATFQIPEPPTPEEEARQYAAKRAYRLCRAEPLKDELYAAIAREDEEFDFVGQATWEIRRLGLLAVMRNTGAVRVYYYSDSNRTPEVLNQLTGKEAQPVAWSQELVCVDVQLHSANDYDQMERELTIMFDPRPPRKAIEDDEA